MYIIDIETSSPDLSNKDLALDEHKNIIDLVGVMDERGQVIYEATELNKAKALIEDPAAIYCGHNFKFDYKTLHAKGFKLNIDSYVHDTLIMAVASIKKIPETYLEQYEEKRRELNKALPHGQSYRNATKHSLKTLAPYFLKVSPFWENTETHNDKSYLALDLEYTKGLFLFFEEELKKQGTYNFYFEKLMPWQRMVLEAELDGIKINLQALDELQKKAEAGVITSLAKLRSQWQKVEEEYYYKQVEALKIKYAEKKAKAIEKAKDKTKPEKRYQELYEKALAKVEPFNYSSPSQLLWALKDCLGYNVVDMEGEEGTGAQVLEVLAKQGKEDIKALLEYREYYKLAHSYFPGYREMLHDGRLHCNFNLHGTRTGRLSSSQPNLQQVPSDLKKLFVADEGNVLVSQDLSAIEPVLIAYYSEDETLSDIIMNGLDFHGVCAAVFGLVNCEPHEVKTKHPEIRYAAKQADLSVFYGSGKNRLFTTFTLNGIGDVMGTPLTLDLCNKMVWKFREKFKDAWEFKNMLDGEMIAGNSVTNIAGRTFVIENPQDVYMKAFNRLIQSSASDLLLMGTHDFLQEMKANGIWTRLRLLVHDNTVIECSEANAAYCNERLVHHLTKFKLPTKHGLIPLKAEGGYGKEWIK